MNWLYTQWDWIQIKWLNMINIRLNIYKMRLNENNMTDINKIRLIYTAWLDIIQIRKEKTEYIKCLTKYQRNIWIHKWWDWISVRWYRVEGTVIQVTQFCSIWANAAWCLCAPRKRQNIVSKQLFQLSNTPIMSN